MLPLNLLLRYFSQIKMAFCYRSDPSAGHTLGKEKMENRKQEKKVAKGLLCMVKPLMSACNITVLAQSSCKACKFLVQAVISNFLTRRGQGHTVRLRMSPQTLRRVFLISTIPAEDLTRILGINLCSSRRDHQLLQSTSSNT